MRAVLLTNPDSGRNRGRVADVYRSVWAACGDRLEHIVSESAEHATQQLLRVTRRPIDVLAINGGDGTFQHLITAAIREGRLDRVGYWAVLPGGTTNMTAADINQSRAGLPTSARRLAALLAAPAVPEPVVYRSVLTVHEGDAPVRAGMFLGAGSIATGVDYFQRRRALVRGPLGPAWAGIRTLWGLLRGSGAWARPAHVLLASTASTRPGFEGDVRFLVASTLTRLLYGSTPFWGDGWGEGATASGEQPAGRIRATIVAASAPAFARRFGGIVRGQPGFAGPGEAAAAGYWSQTLSSFGLTLTTPYTLDGELYQPRAGCGAMALTVSATRPLAFLSL